MSADLTDLEEVESTHGRSRPKHDAARVVLGSRLALPYSYSRFLPFSSQSQLRVARSASYVAYVETEPKNVSASISSAQADVAASRCSHKLALPCSSLERYPCKVMPHWGGESASTLPIGPAEVQPCIEQPENDLHSLRVCHAGTRSGLTAPHQISDMVWWPWSDFAV